MTPTGEINNKEAAKELRNIGRQMVDLLADYIESLDDLPVTTDATPGSIFNALPTHPPEQGEDWDAIIQDIKSIVIPALTHWQSPNFFAYFPANASIPSIMGELLSAGFGVQGMLWSTSPACTEIETRVLDWLADIISLPDIFKSTSAGGGVIQSTVSEATLVAMVVARDRSPKQRKLLAYASSQAHSSVTKAAMISGIGRENVRIVPVNPRTLALDSSALANMLEQDRAQGHHPFFLCTTLGTTSSCAFDPLSDIAECCDLTDVWSHVDAAYAGAMLVCPEKRDMLAGVEHTDSFCFNPHKGLLTNFDCTAFWTRDRAALTSALSVTPEYLKNAATSSGEVIDYRDWQIPLGRRFRALKLWFVIRRFGTEGLRAFVREKLRLAALFASWIEQDNRFELTAPVTTGLVCFRAQGSDAFNERLLEKINATQRIFMTHTTLPEPKNPDNLRYTLRLAVGSVYIREEHVRSAWQLIEEQLESTTPD